MLPAGTNPPLQREPLPISTVHSFIESFKLFSLMGGTSSPLSLVGLGRAISQLSPRDSPRNITITTSVDLNQQTNDTQTHMLYLCHPDPKT